MKRRHAGFASLPDDCLAAVLALVPFRERLATCALVCQRWHRLVTTEPELLREARLFFCRSRPDFQQESVADRQQRVLSLLLCFRRLAPHVQRLEVTAQALPRDGAEHAARLAAELQARLGRCTQLECLQLSLCGVPCTLGPWLAPLAGSLRRLRVDGTTCEDVRPFPPLRLQPGGLAACTQLEALALDIQGGVDAPSAACWPQRLTSLSLTQSAAALPASMSALQSLRRLRVRHYDECPDSWLPLAQLSALTQLILIYCSTLPAPEHMACLTSLQSLELCATPGCGTGDWRENAAELEDALEALQSAPLTYLELVDCHYLDLPPPGLSRLSTLRSLWFACKSDLSPEQISLPPGGWLASLQRLEVPYEIVAAQHVQRQLEAADQLEELVVDGLPLPPPGPLPAALAFIPWAAGRPRMQRLTIVLTARWRPGERSQLQRSESSSPAGEQSDSQFALEQQVLAAMCALTAAALQAQARRPGLAVQLTRIDELHPEEMGLAWDPFA